MANQYKNVKCPSCGAPADNVDRFAAMAVCEYCGGAFYFDEDAIKAMGKMAIMVEYPTPLYVGATGALKGKRFATLGRLRYRYPRGFWDEWYLRYDDGQGLWLAEDEGEFSLEVQVDSPGPIPPRGSVRPGAQLTLANKQVIVDEVDKATLEGAEGSIPFVITKDTSFDYVDASLGDDTITIEYASEGPEVYYGTWIDVGEIVLDNPKEEEDGEWFDA